MRTYSRESFTPVTFTALLSRNKVIYGGFLLNIITLNSGVPTFPLNVNDPLLTVVSDSGTPVWPFNNATPVPSGNPFIDPLITKPLSGFAATSVDGAAVFDFGFLDFVLVWLKASTGNNTAKRKTFFIVVI